MKNKTLMALFVAVATLACSYASAADKVRGLSRTDAKTPFVGGSYRALIIGNNNYQDPTGVWEPLSTAASDAKSVATLLRKDYGFNDVEVLIDATQREILLAMDRLQDRVEDNDSVLVYFAGHGYREEEKKRAYWIPVDAKGQDHTTYIRNSTIRDELDIIGTRAKHTLLISDSCFSGSLLRGGNRGARIRDTGNLYYAKMAKKKSVQILAAGGVEYVDDDYRGSGHSPFTYFLVNELKSNNSEFLTATELSTYVEKAVANNVRQTPESGVLAGTGDELGEFIFKKINISIEIVAEPSNGHGQQANIPVTVAPAKVTIQQPARAELSTPSVTPAPDNDGMMVMFPML